MNRRRILLPLGLLAASCFAPGAMAQTADAASLDQLIDRVKAEARSERRHNLERERRFAEARDERLALVREAEAELADVRALADSLRQGYEDNQAQLRTLDSNLHSQSGELDELFEVARQLAGDSAGMVESSIVAAQSPARRDALLTIASAQTTPSIDDLEQFWITLLDEIRAAGRIERFEAPVIHPDGSESISEVTRVGTFNLIADGRYLKYLPSSHQLIELARQPSGSALAAARRFETAETDFESFYLDPSRGAILGLLVRKPDAQERVAQGGVIGYVILLLGAIGAVVVLYRWLYLLLVRRRMARAAAADETADADVQNPLARLRRIYDQHRSETLETLGVQLNEGLSEEINRLRFGLSTLAVIAAVAPLLGLLGTVTGMIETFQTITLFGTGDPRLMSGGISQALVTTQLGLAVAIPVLLAHSFLEGRADSVGEQLNREASDLISSHGPDHVPA